MKDQNIDRLAKIIWEYHHMHHTLTKADCIFVLCSFDLRVAEYAAELYLKGYAPYLLFSGNSGIHTKKMFNKPEAEVFADIAVQQGVPDNAIIIENQSTNTGENVSFTKKLLEERLLEFHNFILVQKPFMERRTYATFKKVWPEKEFMVTSPQVSYEEYVGEGDIKEIMINVMVGDLERIREYPALGFQIPQEIPVEVWSACEQLIALGYDKPLIRNSTPKAS